jgi:hypothetical protein
LDCLALVFGIDRRSIGENICCEFGLEEAREYFCNARYFLQFHLNHYFKSRRRAPIYWQISVPSKRYSVWLYYHRLNRDTLWRVLNDFVKPKLSLEERRLAGLRTECADAPTPSQRRAIQEQESFASELRAFRDDIEAVAPIWNPNLNDGVLINFAPLWKLVPQLPSWQRELRGAWQTLCQAGFDWTHLAMHLWPERVLPRCAEDRSLAITHGVDGLFWEEQPDGKWKRKKVPAATIKTLVEERTSKAVSAALEEILSHPAAVLATRRREATARRNA